MPLLLSNFEWNTQLTIAVIIGLAVAAIATIYLFTDKEFSQSPHFYDFDRPDGSANVTPTDLNMFDEIEGYRNDFPDAS